MDYQELIIFIIELMGTVAFSVSGAIVGTKQGMDIFGVSVLGVVTAVGGGMIRDIILGITPPSVFMDPVYALVAVITAVLVFAVMYFNRRSLRPQERAIYDSIILMMDSFGLGVFTAIGVLTGIRQGYGDRAFLLVFVGTVTGIGGGMLRDMMAEVPLYVFNKHIYACASIVGAILCVHVYRRLGSLWATALTVFVVVLIRFLAAHYRWNLPRKR